MTKGKDPAFLFYPSDFTMGTYGWNYEQKGKYISLLCLQHSKGGYLKVKDMKRMLDFDNEEDQEILEKFIFEDNLYFNKRLLNEIEKRKKHSQKQRENVMKRWNKESIPSYNDGNTNVLPLENENINENKDINIIEVKKKKDIKHKYGEYKHVLLTDKQLESLKNDFPLRYEKMITNLDEYIEMKGVSYKNHYLTMRKWESNNKKTLKEEKAELELKDDGHEPYYSPPNPRFIEEMKRKEKEREEAKRKNRKF